MKKSPEEYFKEQDFSVAEDDSDFSPAEKAFMEKYMGLEAENVMESIGLNAKDQKVESLPLSLEEKTPPAPKDSPQAPIVGKAEKPESAPKLHELSMDEILRSSEDLQMVAFHIGSQEFATPTLAVQEVIRSVPVTKLPKAPARVTGAISLRGRVTPIIDLRSVLEVSSPRKNEDRFIIVCRRMGIQMGFLIERVHTIYRVKQEDIDWNVDSTLGSNVEHISGLIKLQESLVGIVNIDSIVDSILDW